MSELRTVLFIKSLHMLFFTSTTAVFLPFYFFAKPFSFFFFLNSFSPEVLLNVRVLFCTTCLDHFENSNDFAQTKFIMEAGKWEGSIMIIFEAVATRATSFYMNWKTLRSL